MSMYETSLHSMDPTMLQRPTQQASGGGPKKKRFGFGSGGGPKPPRPPKKVQVNQEVEHETLYNRSEMPYDLISRTNLQLFTRHPLANYIAARKELDSHPVTGERKTHRHLIHKSTGQPISRKVETFLNVYNKRMMAYAGALVVTLALGGAIDNQRHHSAKKSGGDVAASTQAPSNSVYISALVARETQFSDAEKRPIVCAAVGTVALRTGETFSQAEAEASLAPESTTPATLAADPKFITAVVALDKHHVGPFQTPAAANTATVLVNCGTTP